MEQRQKKVAIVVPVYNMEEFLSECIDSILSQTYTNFDIFAVDDASTDRSLEILCHYQEKDSRVVVLKRKNNGGLSAARNTALDEIEKRQSYDFISFCDSDDAISPDMIKNTEDFTEHLNSDRKMFAESDAFLRALLDTVKKARRILLTAWYTGSRPAARNRIRMV